MFTCSKDNNQRYAINLTQRKILSFNCNSIKKLLNCSSLNLILLNGPIYKPVDRCYYTLKTHNKFMLYIIIIQFVFIILLYNFKKISNKRKFLNVFEIFSHFKNKQTKTSTKCISMFKLSNKSTVRIYDHTKQPPIICLTNQSTDRPSICPSMHPSSTTMYERSIDCTINRSLCIQNV